MRFNQRVAGVMLILAFLLIPLTLFAQDSVRVVGSGIAAPLFEQLAEQSELDADVTVTGSASGIAALCAGEADVANSTRAMTVEEEALCAENGVVFAELVLGYDVAAWISHPETEFLTCASDLELNGTLAPSAQNVSLWSEIITGVDEEAEIHLYLPGLDSSAYAAVDAVVNGAGFRSDAEILESDSDIIEAVASTPGAIGVVSLSSVADDSGVTIMDLRTNAAGRCTAPSAAGVSNGTYPAGFVLLSYVQADVLAEQSALQAVFELAAEAEDTGFVLPTDFDAANNADVLMGETGRQFSRSLTDFEIPAGVAGNINVGGAAGAFRLMDTVVANFTTQYATTTVNASFAGEPAGLRQLCNSEIDMAVIYGALEDKDTTNCDAVDVELVEFPLGEQVTVLVANEAAEYLSCMTTDEIVATWAADSADTVMTWADVNSDYPEEAFILFAGDTSNPVPNLMMLQSAGESVALRGDTENSTDPLYRAAATANVETALTYMSWTQYQDVLANEQERIQLVAVDAGDGCVVPSAETVANGDYALSRGLSLVVNQQALERIDIKSFLWFMFAEDNLINFERANMDLTTRKSLSDTREVLQTAFGEADATAAARIEVEATESDNDAADATTEETSDEGDAE